MVKYPPYGDTPNIGQKRIVRITDRNDETMHLYGTFANP